jgi:hypothetical protein
MRVLIDIFPGIWIEEAKTEMRLEEKDGGAYKHHLIKKRMVNQWLPRVLTGHWSINMDILSGKISPLASNYGKK